MKLEFVVDADASDFQIAEAFVSWLEGMGAVFRWRDDAQHDWALALDGISGLTRAEAQQIAREALDHSSEIRHVLRDRQLLTSGVIH